MRKELIDLKKTWYKLSSIYANFSESLDMNPFEFKIYHIIFLLIDDCTQKNLVDFTGETKQAVNNVVKKFEKDGLVFLIVDDNDRRSKKVKLTDKGLEIWDTQFDKIIKMEEDSLNEFSKAEILGFIKFITKYEKLLEEKMEKTKNE